MKTYDIRLQIEKENSYRVITIFFAILHAILFTFFLFDKELWKTGVAGLIFIAVYSIIRLWWVRYVRLNWARHTLKFSCPVRFSYESFFFIGMSLIFQLSFPWLTVLDLTLGILTMLSLKPPVFHFDADMIRKRTFPFTKYKWSDLDNVVLKDNILTLDFKNNKLLQAELHPSLYYGTKPLNEEAFNTFAREHLDR
jgi:hypothetical protein